MSDSNHRQEPIAIIGMACVLPKANDPLAYWRNILDKRDCLTDIPADNNWRLEDYTGDQGDGDTTWATRGGFIDRQPFDPLAHGVIPKALEAIDSDQLIALIVARQCLADAGLDPDNTDWDRSRVSCILGHTATSELVLDMGARLQRPRWIKSMERCGVEPELAQAVATDALNHLPKWQEQTFPGMLSNVTAGRIANRLDLGGTNASVDAACASSLAAVHYAISDLQSGRADLALAGGTDTLNDIYMYMCFTKTPALSKSGDSRPFDDSADGIVISEGVAMMALKRLSDAERDGDRVYAVIKGIGTSSDGRNKSIYAPSASGQVQAVRRAYSEAGFPVETVELIEAHGTGTRAGDLAEFNGLATVFGDSTREGRHVALGSVKSQIGHTKGTAGLAGLMKAVLALHQKVLPPTAKVSTPSSRMSFEGHPLYLNSLARPWFKADGQPRRAGVSAFGFGGTNYHVALEEHAGTAAMPSLNAVEELFLVGADSAEALNTAIQAHQRAEHATVAHASRRVLKAWRPAAHVVAFTATADTLADRWATALGLVGSANPGQADGVHYGQPQGAPSVAVLFPGQGSQYVHMGRTLALRHAPVRQAIERAESALCAAGRGRLTDIISPAPAFDAKTEAAQLDALRATEWAQPAIGALSKGMYDLLCSFGVSPAAVAGHSYGELVALCAAGVYDEAALWQASRVRGEAMADRGTDRGTMAAVSGPLAQIEEVLATLGDGVVLANRNHPTQGVISGSRPGIERAIEAMRDAGMSARAIPVSAAFHSSLVADATEPFAQALAGIDFAAPAIPVYANANAAPYPDSADGCRALLAQQITSPVDFVGIVQAMLDAGIRTFVECGPKGVVSGLLNRCLTHVQGATVLALDPRADQVDGDVQLKSVLAALAAAGVAIDVSPLLAERLPAEPLAAGSTATIWVGGPNFREPSTLNPPLPKLPARATAAPASPDSTPSRPPPIAPGASLGTSMPNDSLAALLEATRQSLVAFQENQEQTARVHSQFLEAHAKASESFTKLFETQARLIELAATGQAALAPVQASAPARPVPMPPTVEVPSTTVQPLTGSVDLVASSRFDLDAGAIFSDSNVGNLGSGKASLPTGMNLDALMADSDVRAAPSAPAPTLPQIDIGATVLDTVAARTGYPVELLDPRMDMEAELGIDSIKRVEILTAIQEAIPGLPGLDGDASSGLRTLGELIEHVQVVGKASGLLDRAAPLAAAATDLAGKAAGSAIDLATAVLKVVADKTGYPQDLLDPKMELESELGIDSIKRVEILTAVQEALPQLPKLDDTVTSAARTLREVIAHVQDVSGKADAVTEASVSLAAPVVTLPAAPAAPLFTQTPAPRRCEVLVVPAPDGVAAAIEGPVALTRDALGVADGLAKLLRARGLQVHVVEGPVPADSRTVVHCAALGSPDTVQAVREAFLAARGATQAALFVTVSAMGGQFGHDAVQGDPVQGALAGLPKTLALEAPGTRCLALDLDPSHLDVARLAAELGLDRGVVEVGLGSVITTLVERPFALVPTTASAPLRPGELVVVTGGARGVTAAVVREMARRWQPALLLLGRSRVRDADPDWAAGVSNEQLKPTRIAALRAAGTTFKLRDVAYDVNKVKAHREVRDNLLELQALGASATYAVADVRDQAAVTRAVQGAIKVHGPVRGVVHGAGVIADKLLRDKTPEQFDFVFQTKVQGLANVLGAVERPELRLVATFSSVAGRYGNRGQVDYSMANEAITHMALHLRDAGVPHVKSFDWGPWAGGMVTPSLRAAFEARGTSMIDLQAGAHAFCDELERGGPAVEVVIGGPSKPGALTGVEVQAPAPVLEGRETIHLSATQRLLDHHRIGQAPVLPFVGAMELALRAVARANPELHIAGVREWAVLKGVRLDDPTLDLDLVFKPATTAPAATATVEVQLLGAPNAVGLPTVHYRGLIDLSDTAPEGRRFGGSDLAQAPYPHAIEQAYERFLFHGPALQGIAAIDGIGPGGLVAQLRASQPSDLDVPGSAWQTDPVVLDSLLQAVVLFVRHDRGISALPSYMGSYRQLAPLQGVLWCHLHMHPTANARGTFDAQLVDSSGRVVAVIEGGQYTASEALNATFARSAEPSVRA